MDFLNKTWKFLLGGLITLLGVLLIFKRKDDSAMLIEKTTNNGNKMAENIIKADDVAREKIKLAEEKNIKTIEEITTIYDGKKNSMSKRAREKIEQSLKTGNAKRATMLLADAFNIKNGDIDRLK